MPQHARSEPAGDDAVLSRDLRRFFDRMSAHFPGHVMQRVLEPDGRVHYTYASPGLVALGLDPAAIMTEADSRQDWIHPDDAAPWRAALLASAQTLETLDAEVRVIGRDGRVRWVRSIGNPRRLASGAVVWDGIALDVTDRREAADALRLAKAHADAAEATKARLLVALAAALDAPLQALATLRTERLDDADRARFADALARLDEAVRLLRERPAALEAPAPAGPVEDPRLAALTTRQRRVLELLGEARSNRDIAAELGITEGTAKLHVAAVLKALGAANRTQAALIARGEPGGGADGERAGKTRL